MNLLVYQQCSSFECTSLSLFNRILKNINMDFLLFFTDFFNCLLIIIIIKNIFKAQNLVPRDYSKRIRTHRHTDTHRHPHT